MYSPKTHISGFLRAMGEAPTVLGVISVDQILQVVLNILSRGLAEAAVKTVVEVLTPTVVLH